MSWDWALEGDKQKHGQTSRLLVQIGPVGRFGENSTYGQDHIRLTFKQ